MKDSCLICDSGPVIIMAKLGVLCDWMKALEACPVVVRQVADELMTGPFSHGEKEELEAFLITSRQVDVSQHRPEEGGLSAADLACLKWAQKHPENLLLADDRLLRRGARHAGISVVGFPGLWLEAVRRKWISVPHARRLLDDAIRLYDYRISIQLYQSLLQKLEALL